MAVLMTVDDCVDDCVDECADDCVDDCVVAVLMTMWWLCS
jgi:hypothetical protein